MFQTYTKLNLHLMTVESASDCVATSIVVRDHQVFEIAAVFRDPHVDRDENTFYAHAWRWATSRWAASPRSVVSQSRITGVFQSLAKASTTTRISAGSSTQSAGRITSRRPSGATA